VQWTLRSLSRLFAAAAAIGLATLLVVGLGSSEPLPSVADPSTTYDPVEAGEALPRDFRQILRRDQIEPMYEPEFTSPGEVDWPGDSLVIGVADETRSKAYPVTFLNQHEMVIDEMGDWPILVSW
jgi:hypothetical protein